MPGEALNLVISVRNMNKREANLAAHPALIPLFGGLDKKPRFLDRDVISVGRARGCDIILEAPDVSTLHCLLYRTAEGFRIRDCGSRTGTRLNGASVRNQVLAKEDVLHVGPFSFQVHLPEHLAKATVQVPEREHLQSSRRNLARLALQLRRRLREGRSDALGGDSKLSRREEETKARIKSFDQRANQLEEAERDLEEERLQLRKEREAFQTHVQRTERELAERLSEVEKDMQQRRREFQTRCSGEENQINREREEMTHMREQLAVEQAEMGSFFDRQRQVLAEAEKSLQEQRRDLSRMIEDLRALQLAIREQQQVDVPALLKENEQLRRDVKRWQDEASFVSPQSSQNAVDPGILEELHAQAFAMKALKEQVAELEGVRQQFASIQKENDQVKKWLAEKDRMLADRDKQIAELERRASRSGTPSNAVIDLETYETELNQERQQLEADRARLLAEMEQLRVRNTELDEATREMEMELSRERAELARERMRLDRLRDEVRAETERMQREAGVRESLAPVQKLREELNQKKAGDNRLNDRLRGMRNQLQD